MSAMYARKEAHCWQTQILPRWLSLGVEIWRSVTGITLAVLERSCPSVGASPARRELKMLPT